MAATATAQATANPNFSVTVNVGPTPPNSDTVHIGELTSLRVSLSNNSTLSSIDNVGFSKSLPTGPNGGLIVAGSGAIAGSGCVDGSLVTIDGQPDVVLSGLTVPPRVDGVPGSGECYIDLPVIAWSTDGSSTSHSYSLAAGEVGSDSGTNTSGGPQAITVRSAAPPQWSKSLSGSPLVLGGAPGVLTIRIENPDANVALNDFGFTDVFPAQGADGAVIEPTGTPASGSCLAAPVNATAILQSGAAAQVAVSGGSLAPNASCTVEVEVRARHTDGAFSQNVNNVIDASGFVSREGLRPPANAVSPVRVRSPLTVTKSFDESPVASGEESGFTISLGNSGGTPLSVTRFADNPISAAPHVGQLQVNSLSNSCGGGQALLDGGNGFEVTGFTIPANGACTLSVRFTGTTPGADTPTAYNNVIPQGAVELTGMPDIVSQPRSANVLVADRLRVLKSRQPATVAPGSAVRYSVTVQNFSSAPLANVTVADQLQNGSTLLLDAAYPVELSPAACGTRGLNGAAQGDSDLLFTIPTVPARAGASIPGACTLSFWVMIDPDATGDTANQIDAGSVCINGNAADCNQNSTGTNTNHVAVLALSKQFDSVETSTRPEGTVSRLSMRLDNFSDLALTSVALSDTFPVDGPLAQLRVASPASAVTSCGGTLTAVPGETSVSLNGGSVAGRDTGSGNPGSCEIQLDVVGPAGTYDNTATVSAVQNNADGSTTYALASDGARLIYTGVMTADKSFSPASTGDGGRATVRVTVANGDLSRSLTGLTVTDPLPAGMRVATPAGAYSSCGNNVVVNAAPGADTVSLHGGTIPAGASCDLVFDVVVDGQADWTNTIAPGGIRTDGGIVNQSPVSATLGYVPSDDPTISKAISPGLIAPGQVARLAITIVNGGTPLSNVSLADYFTEDGVANSVPNGMTIASPAEVSTDCRAGVVVAQPGDASVQLSGAVLDPGEQCLVEVNVTSRVVGTITNHIPLNALGSAEGATNSTTFGQSTLSTISSVNVVKNFEPRVVSPGENSRLRITILNAQASPLRDFSVRDELPAGLQVAQPANAFSNCGGAVQLTWPERTRVELSGGRLAAAVDGQASSCYLELDVAANAEGTYTNLIPENSLTEEGDPLEHPETEDSLEVRERVVVNKAIDGFTLDSGDPVGFTTGDAVRLSGVPAPLTIRLENPTSMALTQVRFIDSLPEGVVIAPQPNALTNCVDGEVTAPAAGRQVRLTGATLAARGDAGASCQVTVDVVSNDHGVYVNEIPAGGVTSFEGISNEEPTQARLVVPEPPSVNKQFDPPVTAPGEVSRLTIRILNPNEAATALTEHLVDELPSLPGQMLVASPGNVATTCPGGAAIVQAAPGASRVRVNSGAQVPPLGCEVAVDVTVPVAGTYINRIPKGDLETSFGSNEEPAVGELLASTKGYISGKVFIDTQAVPDGNYVPGESEPVAGNPIELRQGADCSGAVLETAQTDAQGNYLFSELPAGTYSVCQPVQPADTFNSVTTQGSIVPVNGSTGTPGVPLNPGTGGFTSQITGIVLGNNGNADEVSGSPGNNFSEVLPASISGHVFHDIDGNGLMGPAEPGIAGVEVTLTGPVTATAITDSEGRYSFEGLPPGTYTVTETQPAGWLDSGDSAGTHGGTVGDDEVSMVTLAAGDRAENYDFGERLPAAPAWTASAVCVNNAPSVQYQVTGPLGGAGSANLSWVTAGGRLAERLDGWPASGVLLWPGVEVNGAGEPIAWPGWIDEDGELVPVEDDRIPELSLRLNGNAGDAIVLEYPACPSQPGSTPQSIPTAPRWALWLLAGLLAGVAGLGMAGRLRAGGAHRRITC